MPNLQQATPQKVDRIPPCLVLVVVAAEVLTNLRWHSHCALNGLGHDAQCLTGASYAKVDCVNKDESLDDRRSQRSQENGFGPFLGPPGSLGSVRMMKISAKKFLDERRQKTERPATTSRLLVAQIAAERQEFGKGRREVFEEFLFIFGVKLCELTELGVLR